MTSDTDDRPEDFRAIAELAEAFRVFVELLTDQHSVSMEAKTLVEFAHNAMPRAQHTGLLLLEHGIPRTVAASSDVPERLDRVRAETGEGPALDVLETNDLVISGDVAADPRWPAFGARVLKELNVRSVATYRLHLGRDHRAALIFVSDWPYAFDELTGAIGAIFADRYAITCRATSGSDVVSVRLADKRRGLSAAALVCRSDPPVRVRAKP